MIKFIIFYQSLFLFFWFGFLWFVYRIMILLTVRGACATKPSTLLFELRRTGRMIDNPVRGECFAKQNVSNHNGIKSNHKKTLIPLIFFFLMSIITGCLLYSIYQDDKLERAYVLKDSIDLKLGPGEEYIKIGEIGKSQRVKILEKNKDWFKIKIDDKMGWVLKDNLKVSD